MALPPGNLAWAQVDLLMQFSFEFFLGGIMKPDSGVLFKVPSARWSWELDIHLDIFCYKSLRGHNMSKRELGPSQLVSNDWMSLSWSSFFACDGICVVMALRTFHGVYHPITSRLIQYFSARCLSSSWVVSLSGWMWCDPQGVASTIMRHVHRLTGRCCWSDQGENVARNGGSGTLYG